MAQFDFERDAVWHAEPADRVAEGHRPVRRSERRVRPAAGIERSLASHISNPKLAARRDTGGVAYCGGVPGAEPENDRSSNAC